MTAVPDGCVDLVVTSPPYFNVKDYSKDGYQEVQKIKKEKQIGDIGITKSLLKNF